MLVPVKNTDAPDPSEGITTDTTPPDPARVLPRMPGIESISIDAIVYPLPASAT